jgi:hypothetical protein
MSTIAFHYCNGPELMSGDVVLINGTEVARVAKILSPGTQEAKSYSCEEEGGSC